MKRVDLSFTQEHLLLKICSPTLTPQETGTTENKTKNNGSSQYYH